MVIFLPSLTGFFPAGVYACMNGFIVLGVALIVVCASSLLYHLDHEGPRFANLDKCACIFVATLSKFYCIQCPLTLETIGLWSFWGVGLTCWKLGHKCHCGDRKVCVHGYTDVALWSHNVWHLIGAAAAAGLVVISNRTWVQDCAPGDWNCVGVWRD
jgi:hypothetical protein